MPEEFELPSIAMLKVINQATDAMIAVLLTKIGPEKLKEFIGNATSQDLNVFLGMDEDSLRLVQLIVSRWIGTMTIESSEIQKATENKPFKPFNPENN